VLRIEGDTQDEQRMTTPEQLKQLAASGADLNRPATVDEIQTIKGVTEDLFALLREQLTASGTGVAAGTRAERQFRGALGTLEQLRTVTRLLLDQGIQATEALERLQRDR
jgi:hypothetical protein